MARHLVYLRRSALASSRADELALLCGVSRADADRLLKSKLPQAVRVADSAEAAEDAVAALRTAGVDAFAVSHDELRAFAPLPIRRAAPAIGGLTLFDAEDVGFDVSDVRMIVVGKILKETRRTTRVERGAMGGMAAGYLAGVGPRMITGPAQESAATARDEESFACFLRDTREGYVAMEASFDYRSTLSRLEPAREQNFRRLVEVARAAWPGAACDERLYRWPAAVRTSSETTASAGFLVDTTQKVESGSNAERAMSLACLIYLETFGQA